MIWISNLKMGGLVAGRSLVNVYPGTINSSNRQKYAFFWLLICGTVRPLSGSHFHHEWPKWTVFLILLTFHSLKLCCSHFFQDYCQYFEQYIRKIDNTFAYGMVKLIKDLAKGRSPHLAEILKLEIKNNAIFQIKARVSKMFFPHQSENVMTSHARKFSRTN